MPATRSGNSLARPALRPAMRIAFLLALLGILLPALSASAASFTWSGSPFDGNWSLNSNWAGWTGSSGYPDSPEDTAIFNTSSITHIAVSAIEVDSMIFQAGASAYIFTPQSNFSFSGAGIINISGIVQNFVLAGTSSYNRIEFTNSATAGGLTTFTTGGANASVSFADTSTAGSGTFVNNGGGTYGGTQFFGNSSAANGTFVNNGSTVSGGIGGSTVFSYPATAGNGTFINNGSAVSGGNGGTTVFQSSSLPGNATLIANGGTNGGNGGGIMMNNTSTLNPGAPIVKVYGNGFLRVSQGGSNLGSLEGDGQVFLAGLLTTIGSLGTDTTFSGVIQDGDSSAALNKIGSGTLTLSGASTYTGATTITGGTLAVTSLGNGGSAGPVGSSSSAGWNLILSNGALRYIGSGESTDRLFQIGTEADGGNATIDASGTGAIHFTSTGSIFSVFNAAPRHLILTGTNTSANSLAAAIWNSGSNGPLDVIKNGPGSWILSGTLSGNTGVTINAGTLTLSGANAHQLGTTLNGGTLNLNSATALGPDASRFTINGGTLDNTTGSVLNRDYYYNPITLGGDFGFKGTNDLNLSGGAITATAARTLTIEAGQLTLGGQITGPGAGIIKEGAGALVLSGNNSTATGGLTINAGSLAFSGNFGTIGGITVNGGSMTFSGSLATLGSVKVSGGSLTLSGGSLTAGAITVDGGTLTLRGEGFQSSGTTLNGGTLNLNDPSALGGGGLVINGGVFDNTSGYGLGLSTYSPITLNADLVFTGTNPLDLGGNAVTAAAPRTITINGTTLILRGAITGTGITKAGPGDLVLAGNSSATGGLTVNAGQLTITGAITNAGETTINGGVLQLGTGSVDGNILNNASLVFNNASDPTYAGIIRGSGTLTKRGPGNLFLTGANTYTGATLIAGGTIVVSQLANGGTASGIGRAGNAASNLIFDGGTLAFDSATDLSTDRLFQIGTTTAGGTATLYAANTGATHFTNLGSLGYGTIDQSRTLVLTGTNTGANSLAAAIADNGAGMVSVNKDGSGSWTLSGPLSATGEITVNDGRLTLSGSLIPTGRVTINGGTLTLPGGQTALASITYSGGALVVPESLTSVGALTVNGGSFIFPGSLTSAGQITAHAGTLTLGSSLLYTGNITVDSGRLNLASATALGASTNRLTIGGGSLDNTSGGPLTLSGNNPIFFGNAGFFFLGTDDLDLGAGAVTTTRIQPIYVEAGTLTLGGAISGDYGGIQKYSDGALVLSGSISTRFGGINLEGGTLTLSGNNTYSGSTILRGGTLNLNSATALGTTATRFTVYGGTLDNTSGSAQTLTNNNPITLAADLVFIGTNDLNLGTGALTITTTRTFTINAGALTFGGNFSPGNFGVVKAGAGTLVLAGSNSMTGGITVNAGQLTLSGANTYSGGTLLNAGGTLNLNSATALGAAASALVINGGTLDNTSGSAKTLVNNNPITLNTDLVFTGTNDLNLGTGAITTAATRTFTINAGTLTLGGAVSGAGIGIVKTGAGTLALSGPVSITTAGITVNAGQLTLSGANTYTGGTILNAGGTLNFNSTAALGATASALTINGGTLDNTSGAALTLANNNPITLAGDFRFTGSNNLNLGAGAITVSGARTITINAGALTLAGAVSGTGASIIKAGVGTLAYSSTTANYSVPIVVREGVLSVTDIARLGVTPVLDGGTLQILGGTTSRSIQIGRTTEGATGMIETLGVTSLGTDGSSITYGTVNQARTLVLTGTTTTSQLRSSIADNGTGRVSLIKNGAGTWTLYDTNSYTGGTTINAGTLQIGSTGSITGDIVNNAALVFSQTTDSSMTGVISGSGSLTRSGAGVLTLSAENTYLGATQILSGTIQAPLLADGGEASSIGQSGNSASNLILTGALISTAATAQSTDRLFQVGLSSNGGSGTLSASGAGVIKFTNTGDLAYGTVNQSRTLTLDGTNTGANTLAATIKDNGTGVVKVSKTGPGAWILTGANSYTGGTTISGGLLGFAAGSLGTTGSITFSAGGGLQWATGNTSDLSPRFGALTPTGTTFDTNGNDVTFASVLSGASGRLIKTGAGTLTLAAANTYTSLTTINAGTLAVNGSVGQVTINSNGTLSGLGTIGQVTLNSGSMISPGDGIGRLTTGVETWNGGAGYVWQLADASGARGVTYDWLSISGTINLNATSASKFTIYVTTLAGGATGFAPDTTYHWTIATSTGFGGFGADKFAIDTSGFGNAQNTTRFTITQVGNSLVLNYTSVPEPSAYAIGIAALLGGAILLRRRRFPPQVREGTLRG